MADIKSMNPEELKAELTKVKALLQDAQDERAFTAMQSGQHIKISTFDRIDRDIKRYQDKITEIKSLL